MSLTPYPGLSEVRGTLDSVSAGGRARDWSHDSERKVSESHEIMQTRQGARAQPRFRGGIGCALPLLLAASASTAGVFIVLASRNIVWHEAASAVSRVRTVHFARQRSMEIWMAEWNLLRFDQAMRRSAHVCAERVEKFQNACWVFRSWVC